MRSKKGMAAQHVLVYIITILVFSFILVYGYNAIKGFKDKSEQISYIKFKTDLTSTIKRVSPDYGTVKEAEFFIGGEYQKVCFVKNYAVTDRNALADHIENLGTADNNPIIADSIRSGVDKNVFLFAGESLQESFDIGKIDIDTTGYLCIDISKGKAKIKFEGMGDHTIISMWGD
ncbi:MAG: hypothetical protein U9O94_05800 [Nanoarchaeota archaeon]|nr:hypothetical protein [Nanoarchaeota archaeon]